MDAKRWVVVGGAVFGVVLGAGVVLALNDDSGTAPLASVRPDPSASVNTAVSASPAPTPSPAPSGYLPVDSLGTENIPWDEVGPGWFLVDWIEHPADYGDGEIPVKPNDYSASLLSPDGTWFTAPSLAAAGAMGSMFWLGDEVAAFRVTGFDGGYNYEFVGDTVLISLRDGAVREVVSAAHNPRWMAIASDGSLLSAHYGEYEGGADYARFDATFTSTPVCGGDVQWSAALSPDRARFVCLGDDPAGTTKTIVSVSNVAGAGGTTVIDTFKSYPDSYSILGWFDADTFLLKRWAISESPDAYFTYNIATRKIAEFALPFEAQTWVRFDYASRTYANRDYSDEDGSGVAFLTESGTPLAHITCGRKSQMTYQVSGSFALVTCRTFNAGDWSSGSNALNLVDLKTGAVVATWTVTDNSEQEVSTVLGFAAGP